MPGTVTYTPIPQSPKQPAAAKTFNDRYSEIASGTTNHINGAASRHNDTEVDSVLTDDHAQSTVMSVAATDQHSRNLQLLTMIGQLADSSTLSTDAFAKVAALVAAGIDLKRVGALINTRNASASAGTIVSRGTNAESGFGYLNVWGFNAVNAPEAIFRPIAGQTAPVIVVQNQAGTLTKWNADGAGNTFQAANATVVGQVLAGSGGIAVTTVAGNLDARQLVNVAPAATHPAHTGDVTTPSGSVVTTVAQVGGQTATAVASATAAVAAASNTGVGNANKLAAFNATGGMTFTTATATSFVGPLTGNATGVTANAITTAMIQDSQITSAKIADGAIVTADLADNAVTTVKIVDANVTSAKIAAKAITTGLIADSAVGSLQIADGSVNTAKLADNAVTGVKIAVNSIDGTRILDYSIQSTKMLEGAITETVPPSKSVYVGPVHRWSAQGKAVYWIGGNVDLSGPMGQLQSGQSVYVLIEVNSVPTAIGIPGTPTTAPLGIADFPLAAGDIEPLGFVALSYDATGNAVIRNSNILPFYGRTGFPTAGGSGGGGSAIGHRHGVSGESRVDRIGLDEGFAHPTSPAGGTFVIQPIMYRNASGQIVETLPNTRTLLSYGNPTVMGNIRCYPIFWDPIAEAFGVGTATEAVGMPPLPIFATTVFPLCYLYTRLGAAIVKDFDDTNNAWLVDARVRFRNAGVGSPGTSLSVPEGGTGTNAFARGLVFQNSTTPTAPLTSVSASLGGTGFAFTPAIPTTGALSAVTAYGLEIAAAITTGGVSTTTVAGLHVVPPTISGTGVQAAAYGAIIDGPTYGTNRYGLWVNSISAIAVGSVVNNVLGTTADIEQWMVNNVIVARMGNTGVLTATGITVSGAVTVTGLLTANAGIASSGGDITQTGKAVVGGVGQATNAPTSAVATIGGAALVLRDSAGSAGDGGYLGFGAGGAAHVFAGIKGFYANSATNGTGDLVFGVHDLVTDTTLTEHFRIRNGVGQGASVTGALAVTGGLSVTGLLIQQGGLWGAGAFPTAPTVGETYYRADTHCWYWWDGTNWNLMSTEAEFQVGLPQTTINTTTPTDLSGTLWNPTFVGLGWCYCTVSVTILSNTGQCNLTWTVDGTAAGNAYLAGAGPVSIALGGYRQLGPGAHTFSIKASMSAGATSAIIFTGYGTYEFRK